MKRISTFFLSLIIALTLTAQEEALENYFIGYGSLLSQYISTDNSSTDRQLFKAEIINSYFESKETVVFNNLRTTSQQQITIDEYLDILLVDLPDDCKIHFHVSDIIKERMNSIIVDVSLKIRNNKNISILNAMLRTNLKVHAFSGSRIIARISGITALYNMKSYYTPLENDATAYRMVIYSKNPLSVNKLEEIFDTEFEFGFDLEEKTYFYSFKTFTTVDEAKAYYKKNIHIFPKDVLVPLDVYNFGITYGSLSPINW